MNYTQNLEYHSDNLEVELQGVIYLCDVYGYGLYKCDMGDYYTPVGEELLNIKLNVSKAFYEIDGETEEASNLVLVELSREIEIDIESLLLSTLS